MIWPWKLLHNLVAHPYLALTGALGVGEASATTFHDWTADRAWPTPPDEDAQRLACWDALRTAEAAAEATGNEDLADAINTLTALWAAGFERRAAQALERAAVPLFCEVG